MKKKSIVLISILLLFISLVFAGCSPGVTDKTTADYTYSYSDHSFERNGVALHLDCVKADEVTQDKQILLVHGVTYSSHEFDIDYKDYSLVRFLARNGYAVWRVDISGFGQSGQVKDGFMPDSDYAAEDIAAAVDEIVRISKSDKIDLLGWSWGTVTSSRYVIRNSEHINRLVLYAPILSGIGEIKVEEAFHQNTWEHAADDFQRDKDGNYDSSIIDPVMVEMFCSSCWHYDGGHSPNGGRRDLCVDKKVKLIDLPEINVPTLIICGDNDPYLNYDLINEAKQSLPGGSETKVIPGGAHVIMYEKPYYHEFQEELLAFLSD